MRLADEAGAVVAVQVNLRLKTEDGCTAAALS